MYHNFEKFFFHNKFKIILKLLNGIILFFTLYNKKYFFYLCQSNEILYLYLINTK